MPFLPPNQQRESTEGKIKKNTHIGEKASYLSAKYTSKNIRITHWQIASGLLK